MPLDAVHRATSVSTGARIRVRQSVAIPSLASLTLAAFVILTLAFLVLPSLLVVPMSLSNSEYLTLPPSGLSLRWYRAYFGDPDWIGPTLFSFRIAALTALISTVIGTMAALGLVRGRVPCRDLLSVAITAPMVAPAIIIAIALYSLFARLHLVGTTVGFLLAHTVVAVPYVVLTLSAALYRVDPSFELAALSLGASRLIILLRITLPLISPGVLTGAAFAFITSFDEATVSFFISDVTGKALSKKMFEGIEFEISPIVAAVSTLLTVLSLVVVGGIEVIRMRAAIRMERVHRAVGPV